MNPAVQTLVGRFPQQVVSNSKLKLPLLCVGASGPEVLKLRKLLANWSVAVCSRSQVFDTSLEDAVKSFQRRMFLVEDGIVGTETWEALYAGAPTCMPELRSGYAGQEVRLLQLALTADGQADIEINGVFDRATETAVRDFQRRKGLVVDGIVACRTWQALSKIPR
jgi:peptidoglycan hydrolase-like protein with peptidoglycan-binding domain